MGNKKNPVFTEKAIRVTDNKTGKVSYFKSLHRKTALSHATAKAREEVLAELDNRFTADILTVAEVLELRNVKYTDLTGKETATSEAAASEAAASTPTGDQLDLADAIDEAEAQQDADEGAGQEEQAEQAGEGHGAIFQ